MTVDSAAPSEQQSDDRLMEEKSGQPLPDVDAKGMMQLLPHRYPFLLVDRLIDQVAFESATGIKNIKASEPWFQGHFPTNPVMPGVLIVEAMAQAAGALVVHSLGGATGARRMVYFMSVENARFRRPVTPGDTLRFEVKRIQHRKNVYKFSGHAKVEGQAVAEAVFSAMIMEPE